MSDVTYAKDVQLKDMRDTFIVTVLSGDWPQSNPALGPTYVKKLQQMCRKCVPGISFICFTDREIPGVTTRYLPPWLPGWWGKLYAFAPSNFPLGSRVVVMDLDTVIISLDEILAVDLTTPVFIRDAYFRQHAGSGIFSFKASRDTARIWLDFPHGAKGPPFVHPLTGPSLTDEHWIHNYLGKDNWKGWDEVLPGHVVSFKHDLHQSCEDLPPEVGVVFFDGEPRPHDAVAPWNPHALAEHGARPDG